MKVSVIGGAGRVGSNAAYAIQLGGLVKEIALVDVAEDVARGEALDMLHGTSLVAPQKIYAGGYEALEGSDIIVITAGLRRKPDESRLDLINRNVSLFRSILAETAKARLKDETIILVVSNPVDILTYLAVQANIVPSKQVIGLGTLLDTTRFRSLLADHFKVAATDVNALILGEHGDSMIPVWSSATINGTPLESFPGYDKSSAEGVFDYTKKSGAEVIKLKGGAGYAVGIAIRALVDAIVLDKKSVLPVSTLQTGLFGMKDVCISLPTVVGRSGVEGLIEIKMTDTEVEGLKNSGRVLKETLNQVLQGQ